MAQNERVPAWGLADVELDEGWNPEAEAAADKTRTVESSRGLPSMGRKLIIRKESAAGVINIFSASGAPVFSLGIDELEEFADAIRGV